MNILMISNEFDFTHGLLTKYTDLNLIISMENQISIKLWRKTSWYLVLMNIFQMDNKDIDF